MRLLVITCLFLCAAGLKRTLFRSYVGKKLSLSKLTMAGGQISDADMTKPTLVYFDAR